MKSKKTPLKLKIEAIKTKIIGEYNCDRCNSIVILKKQLRKNCRYYHCNHCGDTRFYYGRNLGCFCHVKKANEFKETRNGWFTYFCPEHYVRIFSRREWVNHDLQKINPNLAVLQNVKYLIKGLEQIKKP